MNPLIAILGVVLVLVLSSLCTTIVFIRERRSVSKKMLIRLLRKIGHNYHQIYRQVLHNKNIPAENRSQEIFMRLHSSNLREDLRDFLLRAPIFFKGYHYPHQEENTNKFLEKLYPLLEVTYKDYSSDNKSIKEVLDDFFIKLPEIIDNCIEDK